MGRARIAYSTAEICAVTTQIHRELCGLGLFTNALKRTPVVTVNTDLALKGAYGLYVTESHPWYKVRGFPRGSIVVPLVSLQGIIDRMRHKRASLRDTLRHEMGHAFAYTSGRAVRKNRDFMKAFGADHDQEARARYRTDCINLAAMLNPAEDFAECFAAYARYEGDIKRFKRRGHLYDKMRFVQKLPREIKKAGTGIYTLPRDYIATVREA